MDERTYTLDEALAIGVQKYRALAEIFWERGVDHFLPSEAEFVQQFTEMLKAKSERLFVLEHLAGSANQLQTLIDSLRNFTLGPVDVEPLVLLKEDLRQLFGRVFNHESTDAEVIAEVNVMNRKLAAALDVAVKDLKKARRKQ